MTLGYSSESGREQRKTVTRSFRINEAAFAALEEEAAKRNVSVNTLLNQQILSYASFDRYFLKLGLIKISTVTFQRLLEAAPDEEIIKAAEAAAADTATSIIIAKNGDVTLDSTMEYLQMLSEYANQFEYNESKSANGRVITLFHRLGPKGSVFYANYAKTLFRNVGYTPKIIMSEHSVDFEILPNKEQVRGSDF